MKKLFTMIKKIFTPKHNDEYITEYFTLTDGTKVKVTRPKNVTFTINE